MFGKHRYSLGATILAIVVSLSAVSVHGRGLFGGLGRKLRNSIKGVTSTVTETVHGIKSDVETNTGIPISKLEMKKRLSALRKAIDRLHASVKSKGEMDAAVVYLWKALGQIDPNDDEMLRKLIEYLEGTLAILRKTAVSESKFKKRVQRLETRLLNLSDHRTELDEGFDFVAYFRLEPKEDDTGAVDSGAADPGSETGGDGAGDEGGESVDTDDPVLAEYYRLKEKYQGAFKGNGYLKVVVGSGGGAASFSILDPESGDILAENAAVNRNHRIRSGIFHLVVNVGDVTLYRFNVVIRPRRIAQVRFLSFGRLKLDEQIDQVVNVYEKKTLRPAYEGLSGGCDILLPIGAYIVSPEDGSVEKEVVVAKGKTVTVSF